MSLPHIAGEFAVVFFDKDNDVRHDGNKTWAKLRCVAKDRVRDANGTWSDGDPCFIDIYVNGKLADNVGDSVRVGDYILIAGKLAQKEWTSNDGTKHDGYRIYADEFGVSTRFSAAPSERVRAEAGTQAAVDGFGGTTAEFDEPPF